MYTLTKNGFIFQTIRNHVVENMISSESFKPDLFYDIPTRQDAVDVVRKNGKLKVRIQLNVGEYNLHSNNV